MPAVTAAPTAREFRTAFRLPGRGSDRYSVWRTRPPTPGPVMTTAPPTPVDLVRAELRRLLPPAAHLLVDAVDQPQGMTDRQWAAALRAALGPDNEAAVVAAQEAVARFRVTGLERAVRAGLDLDPDWWAERLAADQLAYVRQRLEDKALDHLLAAFHGYDPARPLGPWAAAVLQNRLQDQFRAKRREDRALDHLRAAAEGSPADPPQVDESDDGSSEAEDPSAAVAAAFAPLNAALAAADLLPDPGAVDYYAVFVFDLRVRLGERLGAADEADPCPLRTAANYLPWPGWVGPRRFRDGWPRLADLWAEAARRGRALGRRPAFVGGCARAVDPTVDWVDNTWNQWTHRGRERVRPRVPGAVWADFIEPLLIGGREGTR